MSEDWSDDALCSQTDPEAFFPAQIELGDEYVPGWNATHEAKAVCGRCPVTAACLTFALDNNEAHGIWGGLTAGERKRLRRRAA